MRRFFFSLTILVVSGFLSSAMAFKVAQPESREVLSANGKYRLKIHAESGVHKVYEGKKELWSFERKVWHDEYFVSNDGRYVLWVAWVYVKDEHTDQGEAVIAYSAKGKAISWTYKEISKPKSYQNVRPGPIGDFWRYWREGVKQQGNKVIIAVTDKKPFVLNLENPTGGD